MGRDRRGVRLVEKRTRDHLPAALQHSSEWGTAVNVQAMVFGNLGDDSATGVAFTRDPANGEKVIYGEYLVNAQGEDVVAGVRTPKQIAEMATGDAGDVQGTAACAREARAALPRHAGPRVHDRKPPPVHPADAKRQTHRRRGDPHRGGDDRRKTDGSAHRAAEDSGGVDRFAAGAGVRSARAESGEA